MQEKSYMLAIPTEPSDINSFIRILNHLNQSRYFKVLSSRLEETSLKLELESGDINCWAEIYLSDFDGSELPEIYRIQHFFPDVDIAAIEKAVVGISVAMEFGKDALAYYHLQLRIIDAILPDKLAVLDESSEKILSGRWVTLAAASNIPPAPSYLFTVQAVAGENTDVWLHSHGLNRCGITELEILNSTKDMYQIHYSIIERLANRILEADKPLEPGDSLYLARLSDSIPMIVTIVGWEEAIRFYDDNILGGLKDRKDGHNRDTSAIFVYQSKEDYENHRMLPVSVYDEYIKQNPIYMISNDETDRMKALAQERLPFLRRALSNRANHILLKLGLEIDEEYRTEDNFKEHIWFELLKMDDDRLTAKLTQEPYYISGLHEGDTGLYTCSQITDWLIYTPQKRLSPDDVYLMDLL